MEPKKYLWEKIDPQQRVVRLTQERFDDHIIGDHSEEDAQYRSQLVQFAGRTIENPLYIFKNSPNPDDSRLRYVNMDFISGKDGDASLQIFVVVTDSQKEEVETFIPMKRIKPGLIEGMVVYDARDPSKR
jgi:hypothetical protein